MKNQEKRNEVYEKENLIDILTKAKRAIQEQNIVLLKEMSNRTIHSASIYQDTYSITLAILMYSLSKIFEREQYKELPGWKNFSKDIISCLDSVAKDLRKNDIEKFKKDLLSIRVMINKFAGPLKTKVEEVFRKASVNKASRIYEHGISLEQTANLLGISVFELVEYAGKTGISDIDLSITMDIGKRIKKAMEAFR